MKKLSLFLTLSLLTLIGTSSVAKAETAQLEAPNSVTVSEEIDVDEDSLEAEAQSTKPGKLEENEAKVETFEEAAEVPESLEAEETEEIGGNSEPVK